jgi:tRNA(fMet)-specific endonuclease VapC
MILVDTDHLTVITDQRHAAHAYLMARLDATNEPRAVPVVCVEEQCQGWLALIHRIREVHRQIPAYAGLQRLFDFFRDWEIVGLGDAAADQFEGFRRQKIRIGSRDLKIASIALCHQALLLSANLRDFRHVPGLRVEDWLVP